MSWLLAAVVFVVANFLVYTLALRHIRPFSTEKVILLYQVASFTLLPVLLYAFGPATDRPAPGLAAAVALHAIYSLSFLELWSLSEGSYSIRMLDRVDRLGKMPQDADISDLERIGASKKANRLGSLLALGLIDSPDKQLFSATALGRIVASPLRVIVWLANIRDRIG